MAPTRPGSALALALALGGGAPAAAQQNTTPPSAAARDAQQGETVAEEAAESRSPLALERPQPRQGLYAALGVYTLGAMAFDDDRGTRQPTFGAGVGVRVGEAVTSWLDLGLALAVGSTQGKEEDALFLGRFTIHSQWYITRRWFLQAGFGATNGQGADPNDLQRNRGRYGDVYLAGLGANLFLSDAARSGGWVLSPVLTIDVGPDADFTTTALWLGLEVSWWSGLSRDKLELPVGEAYD
jgi:hypothetical protein